MTSAFFHEWHCIFKLNLSLSTTISPFERYVSPSMIQTIPFPRVCHTPKSGVQPSNIFQCKNCANDNRPGFLIQGPHSVPFRGQVSGSHSPPVGELDEHTVIGLAVISEFFLEEIVVSSEEEHGARPQDPADQEASVNFLIEMIVIHYRS